MEPERDDVADRGRRENRHAQRPRHLLARARQGGGLRERIVAHQRDDPPEGCRARDAGMADGVGRPIEPGVLAEPESHHSVEAPPRQFSAQLCPPDRGGGQLLVEARGEDHVRLAQQCVGAVQLLVEAAQWRSLVPADEGGGREVAQAVQTPLGQHEPDQRLNAREEDRALGRFVAVAHAHGPHRSSLLNQGW